MRIFSCKEAVPICEMYGKKRAADRICDVNMIA